MQIIKSATFSKQIKKLHTNQKKDLDLAVMQIMSNPQIGDLKKGDLSGVFVYKFSMVKQLTLLAYTWHELNDQLILISLGAHENFYRDLKN